DPRGYFYQSVFDGWSWDPRRREICAYKTQRGVKLTTYQAGLREGGGLTIAALARVAALKRDGDFPSSRYLAAAEKGFAHLAAGKRSAFVSPHHNEPGYWWQGEPARLPSLAPAALLTAREAPPSAPALRRYAVDQLDWILGLNPFDISMLQGRGRHNPDLLP